LDLFDDILIPAGCLQPGSHFDKSEQLWVWRYDENDLYMDVGEPIRFRVMNGIFVEEAPVRKEVLMANRIAQLAAASSNPSAMQLVEEESKTDVVPPYKLVGSIAEDGLGLLAWWGGA